MVQDVEGHQLPLLPGAGVLATLPEQPDHVDLLAPGVPFKAEVWVVGRMKMVDGPLWVVLPEREARSPGVARDDAGGEGQGLPTWTKPLTWSKSSVNVSVFASEI